MIKQFKSAVITAVVLGATLAVAAPSYATEKHKVASCSHEAKKAGLKDAKEIKAYVKQCKHKRAEAKKHAKKHVAKKKTAKKAEAMKAEDAKAK